MTRTILKAYLKDLYVYLSPFEKQVLCQRYKTKYQALGLEVLKAFGEDENLPALHELLLSRKNKVVAVPELTNEQIAALAQLK